MEAVKINLNHDETQGCKAKALASSVFVLYIVINVQMLLNCEWGPKCRLPESFRVICSNLGWSMSSPGV
ncbi:hypothetical protein NC652_000779 [Populus alba x Populus x berolinensis]|nr:hypothetical protein NC652_000779 [Populus alba x Populus x berolinensis]